MDRKESFVISRNMPDAFREYLKERENAAATIEKYMNDIRIFYQFIERRYGFSGDEWELEKAMLLSYKEWLSEQYALTSANSMIAALNGFLQFAGADTWKLKRFRIQIQCFRAEEKAMSEQDYKKLKETAQAAGKQRLAMLIETIASVGIRISELKYFTVEAVRKGRIQVRNKGKERMILMPGKLRVRLMHYVKQKNIKRGPIFCTRSGRPQDRSNVWKELKNLARIAGVDPEKAFPHNLRHLFARTFYKLKRDIVGLADLLGHSNIAVTRMYARNGLSYYQAELDRMSCQKNKNAQLHCAFTT